MPYILEELGAIIGAENLLAAKADRYAYSRIPFVDSDCLPIAVARPRTVERLAALVRFCAANKIRMAARGAGCGFPTEPLRKNTLLILFDGLNRILEINPACRCAHVQAGISADVLNEAAATHGLFFPHALTSFQESIGGILAQNNYNLSSLKYGPPGEFVLALDIVSAKGDLFTFFSQNCLPANLENALPLAQLFCGSRGRLGFIASAALRLAPLPSTRIIILAAFRTINAAAVCASSLMASTLAPVGMEIFDPAAAVVVDPDVNHALLALVFAGEGAETDANQARDILASQMALSIRMLSNPQAGATSGFYRKRRSLAAALCKGDRKFHLQTAGCPPDRLPAMLDGIKSIMDDHNVEAVIFGHAGIARLHAVLFYSQKQDLDEALKQLFTLEMVLNKRLNSEQDINADRMVWSEARQSRLSGEILSMFDPDKLLS